MPTPDDGRIARIFFPYMDRKRREAIADQRRFVYYTSADTAASILKDKQLWMRSTTAMNDYMEVEHGFECLNPVYKTEPGERFRAALDAYFPGLDAELLEYFNGWLHHIRYDTYMTCVSEHSSEEDRHGRLSMWRAYGGQAGVALVLNGAVMFSEGHGHALGAYASPVAYLDPDEFAGELMKVVTNIEGEGKYIRSLEREHVKHIAFDMLRYAMVCTKHPGFREEREWRIVASPTMYPSQILKRSVEVVRGTPQTVLKICLQNPPGLVGLALPEFLNRIIIGPCEFPQVILTAFLRLLDEAGVPEFGTKVVVSDIPLRSP